MKIIKKATSGTGEVFHIFRYSNNGDLAFGFFCKESEEGYGVPVVMNLKDGGLFLIIDILCLKLELNNRQYLDFLTNFETASGYCLARNKNLIEIMDTWVLSDPFLDTVNNWRKDGIQVNLEVEDLEGHNVLRVA